MERKYLYSHDGQVHGPLSIAQMKERAARGEIAPADKVWREGSDPQTALPASQAFDFRKLKPPAGRPTAASAPAAAAPPAPAEAKKPEGPVLDPVLFSSSAAHPHRKRKTSGLRTRRSKVETAKTEPVSPKTEPAPPVAGPATPVAAPVIAVQPVQVAMVATRLPEAIPVDPPGPLPTTPLPAAIPVDDLPPLPPAVAAVYEDGLSVNDRYRRACSALGQWADCEENAALVMAGDTEAICTHPDVLEILRPFQKLPFEIIERLMEYLDTLIENRASYYRALAASGKRLK